MGWRALDLLPLAILAAGLVVLVVRGPAFWRDSSRTERGVVLLALGSVVAAQVAMWVLLNPTLYQVLIITFFGLLILLRVLRGRRLSRTSENSKPS